MRNVPVIDKDGTVVNVVVLDDESLWAPPEGCTLGPEGGNMGDVWDGQSYTRPPPVPREKPPEKTPVEKLAAIGLTPADLKALLAD
jgi:hypothetical protein